MQYILILIALYMGGCSQDDEASRGHVWEEQTATMDKARQAEQAILDSAEAQRKMIEEQSR